MVLLGDFVLVLSFCLWTAGPSRTAVCGTAEGQSQVVTPSQPIMASVGDDVILPCHLKPATDASELLVEWARPDLSPGFVYERRNSREDVTDQQPSYRGRTSLLVDRLKLGDVSLNLSTVKLLDEGTYRCLVPTLGRPASIKLIVGAASSPVIVRINRSNSDVVLQCWPEGWYPEPEVLWLDGEGNLLSAGPAEAVRGPGGLYTVNSTLTVEKRHSINFTCRVQLKSINQTRETHLHVPVPSRSVKWVLAPGFLGVLLCAGFTVQEWRLRRKQVTAGPSGPESIQQVGDMEEASEGVAQSRALRDLNRDLTSSESTSCGRDF